jgi:hypothetical protein
MQTPGRRPRKPRRLTRQYLEVFIDEDGDLVFTGLDKSKVPLLKKLIAAHLDIPDFWCG